ncbi:MAG: nitric oxide reductase activation protein NorD [Betaproteobacteria bacterium]|nr:nitric oxide reductase activation protein NorD [Betaproteobacteria bacterium]
MLHLEDYSEILESLGSHAADVLHASWQEAARTFSPRGLEDYLKGAVALKNLGRGPELVATYLQEAPAVAKEIGEAAVSDLVHEAMLMASRTSGAVIELVFATAPVAARRLGDEGLFRGYLRLLNTLLAQAPRGLRPMLEHLEPLLSQLTLGGLRRWALWGAQAHRTDFEAQVRYFSLQSPDALSVLQKERKGTLLVDVQRRIGAYLRALWGRDFFLRPTSGDIESREGLRPFIEDFAIHLPDAYDDLAHCDGLTRYRAAATHCAAHLAYTRSPISAQELNPLQMALIGLVEDARVEQLAIRRFPGLKDLWGRLHTASPDQSGSAGDFLSRLARVLLDADYNDPHPWLARGRELFWSGQARLDDNGLSWEIGVALANCFGWLKLPFDPRSDAVAAPYRDDNRYFWDFDELHLVETEQVPWQREKQVRKHVSLMEFVNEVDVETAGDDAQEVWVLSSELYDDDGTTFNEREGKPPVSEPYHYDEWDYQIQLERPSWVTLLEKRPPLGEPKAVDDIAARHKPLIGRLKYLIEALQPQGVQRLRRQEDGDEIDLNAAVRAFTDLRLGNAPDTRIMIRNVRKRRDLSVLLLLDLSESTNDRVRGAESTVLSLAREATALLAGALEKIGDPFAIHGFASNGRHDVEYYRFKDFGAPYDALARARLAGMTGQLSTRMGAALRHAGAFLRRQPQAKKLLLVLTDGEPADIDVRDPQYLRQDAKKAVEELARSGIVTYAMSLDPLADPYVSRIFGVKNYLVLDRVERLPERLPLLYLGLTR